MKDLKRILLNAGLKSSLFEGTWSAPQTEKQALELQELMQKPIPSEDAAGLLYHLIGDDDLFDQIGEVEDKDGPDVDVRYLVVFKLKEWIDDMDKTKWQNSWDPKALDIIKNLVQERSRLKETMKMTLDDAKFVVKASRDWLDRKQQLENFKTTGDEDRDFQRYENIQEEMAHIAGYLEDHKVMHGYGTVNEMFQAAKQMILQNKNESTISEGTWQTSKMLSTTDKYGEPLLAQKMTHKGIDFYITADPDNPYDSKADYVGWVNDQEVIRSQELSVVKQNLLARAKELTSESKLKNVTKQMILKINESPTDDYENKVRKQIISSWRGIAPDVEDAPEGVSLYDAADLIYSQLGQIDQNRISKDLGEFIMDTLKGEEGIVHENIEDDEEMLTTYLHAEPKKYDPRDLIEIANSRLGGMIAEQLANIMGYDFKWSTWGGQSSPQPMEKQNSNALKRIAEFLHNKNEEEMAQEIKAYLNNNQFGESLDEEYEIYKEQLAFEEFENLLQEFGVGTYDPRSNKTADVGPDTLQKNAAKFGNKVSKGGVPPRVSKNSFVKENENINDEKIWKLMSDKMTTKTGPKDVNELRYYIISPNKIAVQYYDDFSFPEAIFARPSWKQLNITKDEFVKWLEENGIKRMKKPKSIKSSIPYYD